MKIIENCHLKPYNSYKLDSVCRRAFFPKNENELIEIVTNNEDFILIGSGHNIILSKLYYDTDFIIFNNNFDKIDIDINSNILSAEAGANFLSVSNLALDYGLSGMEFCYDIPSSVGGGVIMNAGTKEGEIKDILLKVRYFDLKKMIIEENESQELNLQYRNSVFQNQNHKIVLKAWFQLSKGEKSQILESMKMSKERRWSKQPREYPNSGSVFKRPPNRYVGPMLDELGLKGYTIGGAKVSKKHSGFIINYNNANGKDILDLIKHIQSKVKDAYGIDLEVEQRII